MDNRTPIIAVLSINVGDYSVFWKDFFLSAEENLFPEAQKEYFVFTDKSDTLDFVSSNNVKIIEQEDLGWPFNTMKRFEMFNRISDKLEEFDYIFFANANAKFVKKLSIDIINFKKDYIVAEHPGYHFAAKEDKPFERRIESKAFTPYDDGRYYVQGAFYGGKASSFLKMTKELDKLTKIDLNHDIVAVWHDESFLNMFVAKNIEKVQILGWQYLFFEERVFPYKPVILLRDKRKYLSNKNDRFKGQNYKIQYFLLFLRNLKWSVMIAFRIINKEENITEAGLYVNNDITEHRMGKQ